MTPITHPRPASTLTFLLLLVLALWAAGCERLGFAPRREVDRRELARKIEAAIERAGRSQVRFTFSRAVSAQRPETALELEAGVEVYAAVLAALEREARANGLTCIRGESRTREGWRIADLRLLSGRKQVWRCKLQEVRRLLHAAIIIDDLGGNLGAARQLLALPYPLTFSVLPHLCATAQTATEARRAGREVMLHLPMQPQASSHASAGQGVLCVGMTGLEVERTLESDLASVPQAVGVNNHMGSRATADPRLMAEVMRVLAARHLFFIDSRTTPASVALEAARRQGIPAFYRSVFLDDTETVPYTLKQLRRFRRVLEQQGAALAIGHPYPSTIAALAKFLPEFEKDGVDLTAASQLFRLPEIARLKPPPPSPAAR